MKRTTNLSTPETDLIEQILSTAEKIKKFADTQIFTDITILQFNILGEIILQNSCTINTLRKDLIMSQASLSQTLNRMERDSLIMRKFGKNDRREVELVATDIGKKLYEKRNIQYMKIASEKLKNISEQEMRRLTELLELVESKTL